MQKLTPDDSSMASGCSQREKALYGIGGGRNHGIWTLVVMTPTMFHH